MFQTTPEQIASLEKIKLAMELEGVDPEFLASVIELSRTDRGVYDLMVVWLAAESKERVEIVEDLQEALDDYQEVLVGRLVAARTDAMRTRSLRRK